MPSPAAAASISGVCCVCALTHPISDPAIISALTIATSCVGQLGGTRDGDGVGNRDGVVEGVGGGEGSREGVGRGGVGG